LLLDRGQASVTSCESGKATLASFQGRVSAASPGGHRELIEVSLRAVAHHSSVKAADLPRDVASLKAKLDRVIAELDAPKRGLAEAAGPKLFVPGDRD